MSRASDIISDAAAEWLVRLEGHTSPDIWEAFESWMDQDPRHRAAFIRLRVYWNRVDRLKNMRPADGSIDPDLLARTRITPSEIAARGVEPMQGRQRNRLEDLVMPDRRRVLAATTAIAATGVFAWFGAYHFGWTSYETTVGGRAEITLSDGSLIDLNTNTGLNARLSGSSREIRLSRGEALFHVAHDSKRPFYVLAQGTVVRAVGTAFSVRIRDPEHVDVLVAEGRVAVGAPGKEANFENPSLLASAPKVSAGQSATVQRNAPVEVHSIPGDDIQRKLAWTAGHLEFHGETLEDAVAEFNRYNERQITIADPALVGVPVGGLFGTTDTDSFVATLRKLFDIQAQVDGDNGNIRLLSSGKPP
jgi:transmembrane sensor